MRGDKVLGNYNSEQLLYFLTSQIQKGNKFIPNGKELIDEE